MNLMESLSLGLQTTAVGLVVVFFMLMLIIILIVLISKLIAFKTDSKPKAEEVKAEPKQDIPVEEDIVDDLELIAVISAAVAAMLGQENTNGFVVRSVRNVNGSAWQRSARRAQLTNKL